MSRLLIIQDCLRHGGTESHTVWLAAGLRARGVEARVLTFRPGGQLMPRARAAGVPVTSLQKKDTGLDWYTPGFAAAVKALAPDAVLLMGKMANARAGAVREALPGVRLVGAVRTGHKLPWFVRRALPVCDALVCNSGVIAGNLKKDGVFKKPITIIANPPVLEPRGADAAWRRRLREQWLASDADRVLLCVAGFRPGKGQRALIEALAKTPQSTRLVLWLAGDGETRAEGEVLVDALRIRHRVRFLGHCDDPRGLYLAADLAVLASEAEALPNFLVEAQLHGLPVLAADVGGVKETFLPGESGELVAPGDEQALVAALLRLAEDSGRLASYAAKAAAWAPGVFSAEAALDAYRKVFRF